MRLGPASYLPCPTSKHAAHPSALTSQMQQSPELPPLPVTQALTWSSPASLQWLLALPKGSGLLTVPASCCHGAFAQSLWSILTPDTHLVLAHPFSSLYPSIVASLTTPTSDPAHPACNFCPSHSSPFPILQHLLVFYNCCLIYAPSH